MSMKMQQDANALSRHFISAISEACMENHAKLHTSDVEELLTETLKHAPHKPGGAKYKVNIGIPIN